MSNDVGDLLSLVSDRPIDAEIAEIVKEMNGKTREFKTKKELLELVRAIVEISEKLNVAREGLRNGRLRFAAEEVKEMKKVLRVSDDYDQVDDREPVVYSLLRKEWSNIFEEVNWTFLSGYLEKAATFSCFITMYVLFFIFIFGDFY